MSAAAHELIAQVLDGQDPQKSEAPPGDSQGGAS